MSSTAVVGSGACHNCGAPLHGRFCSACGQKDHPLEPTAGEVLAEVARELSDLDGRILRSVRRLFLSPGFLTKEYFEGRRVSWVSPVRLYLVFSVSYFAITSLTGASPLDIDIRFTGEDEDVRQTMQRMGFSSAQEMDRAINEALTAWIPRAMFVLVPVFAWLVSRVRRRTGWRYPHHLIFAFHVFAAFFGVQAIAVAAGHVAGNGIIAPVLAVSSGVYGLAYTAAALRSVYGGTIRRALVHTLIVLFFYWIATVAVAAAIVVPVVFRD